MPRTFSLARLMLGITGICILSALAAKFPDEAADIASKWICWAPSVVVLLSLIPFSKKPIGTSFACLIGATLGASFLRSWAFTVLGDPGPFGQENLISDFVGTVICAPVGALLFGGAYVVFERTNPAASSTDERLDQKREIEPITGR